MVKTLRFHCSRVAVPSLIGALRSHLPGGPNKQTKNKQITVKTILSLQTTQTWQPRSIPQAGVCYASLARMNPTDFYKYDESIQKT